MTDDMLADPRADELRQRLDRLDEEWHDLMIARAALAAQLAPGPRHPDRAALTLRRLAARHQGELPFAVIARIWSELEGATAYLAHRLPIAVYVTESMPGLGDLARAQYGSHVPIQGFRQVGQVVAAVADAEAALGILPNPAENDPDPWWRHIASRDPAAPRVVARLPFAGRGNARPSSDAFAIALAPPEREAPDRSLLTVEIPPDTSRTRIVAAFAAAGFEGRILAVDPTAGHPLALAEVLGAAEDGDPRIAEVALQLGQPSDRIRCIGGYAETLVMPADESDPPLRAAS
jgi:hypothetical protein